MRSVLRSVVFVLLLGGLVFGAGSSLGEPFTQGLLWEISRPGSATSYLFGTMHSADPRLLNLDPRVEQAFADSRAYVLEMYPDELVARRFGEAAELPAGQQLSALLPAPVYADLQRQLLRRGLSAERIDRCKPWAALLLLTEGQRDGGPDRGAAIDAEAGGGQSLDLDFFRRARGAGKTIDELDSVEEQIAVFDGLPEATQVALLSLALARHAQLSADHEQNVAAYRQGDLARLMAQARHFPGASAEQIRHLALLEKTIIRDRSVVMVYRLQTFLRRGSTFAAVGALHLYGRQGMLQLLLDDGWTVRRRD